MEEVSREFLRWCIRVSSRRPSCSRSTSGTRGCWERRRSIWCGRSFGFETRQRGAPWRAAAAGVGGRVADGTRTRGDRGARDRVGVIRGRIASRRPPIPVPASRHRDRQCSATGGTGWRSTTARASIVESGARAPIRRDRLQRERDFVESLEIAANYNATFTLLSGISLDELVDQCRQCLTDTEAVWGDLLPRAAQRSLGVRSRRSDASRCARPRPCAGVRPVFPGRRQWRRRCAAR